jgi:hypothetical protein
LNLLGLAAQMGAVIFILELFAMLMSLYISLNIVMGVKDMESIHVFNLNASSLYSFWKLIAAFSLIAYFLYLIPGIAVIALILWFIFAICFLASFNKVKRLYSKMQG